MTCMALGSFSFSYPTTALLSNPNANDFACQDPQYTESIYASTLFSSSTLLED